MLVDTIKYDGMNHDELLSKSNAANWDSRYIVGG